MTDTPADNTSAGRRPLGRGSLLLSLAVHSTALAAFIWLIPALRAEPIVYETIAIQIESPPPLPAPPTELPPAAQEELVVESPEEPEPEVETPVEPPTELETADPEPDLEEPEPDPEDDPDPEDATPEPPQETDPQDDPPPPATDSPTPTETPVPVEAEEDDDAVEGGQDLLVLQAGFRNEHPAYFNNIIYQVNRCLRWRGADTYEAVITFLITRDGKVTDIDIAESSRSIAFDTEAMGAVECAGTSGRLGPLPEGWPRDVLPIQFLVEPRKN